MKKIALIDYVVKLKSKLYMINRIHDESVILFIRKTCSVQDIKKHDNLNLAREFRLIRLHLLKRRVINLQSEQIMRIFHGYP